MDSQFWLRRKGDCSKTYLFIKLFIQFGFVSEQGNTVFFVREVGVELVLLLRHEPLLDVKLAHVNLLEIKGQYYWNNTHQVPSNLSLYFKWANEMVVLFW
jgi:hypothetical protein